MSTLTQALGGSTSFRAVTDHIRCLAEQTHRSASIFDDIVGVILNSLSLVKEFTFSTVRNLPLEDGVDFPDQPEFPTINRLEEVLDASAEVVGFGHTGAHLTRLLSGSLFYKVTQTGAFALEKIPTKDGSGTTFRKVALCPFTIAANVFRVAASIFRSIRALNTLRLANLGRHARNLLAPLQKGLNLLASLASLIKDALEIRDAIQISKARKDAEQKPSCAQRFGNCLRRCKEAMFSLVCNFVDAVCEILGILYHCVPAIFGPHGLIIMGILGLLSSVGNLVLDIIS